jgi:hypothetical protein
MSAAEREQKKREIFAGMSPRRQRRILEKGYERWDPFLAPKEPPFCRPKGEPKSEERVGPGDRVVLREGECPGDQSAMEKRTGRGDSRPDQSALEPTAGGPQRSLKEIREILLRRQLLDGHEELVESMLEDLVHYAYFTGCLTRADVGRLLGLAVDQARQKIRVWKKWHEGNRYCQARQNPFFEAW